MKSGTAMLALAGLAGLTSQAQAQVAPGAAEPAPQQAPAIATPPAEATPAATAPAADIVVTGSRLTSRGFEAPTPVTVVDQQDVKLSGTQNIETLLGSSPQFVGSQLSGPTANTVPAGVATLNLRGFGDQRNLVLVNGRRFAISGPQQTTDVNAIPSALIKRTEVVTGGSSAVYGSDAISGVVNFIMRDDFQGLEVDAQNNVDQHTGTPNYTVDVTAGRNFDGGRGNITLSFDYLNRGGYTRGERGGWATPSLADGCVTSSSWSRSRAGTPLAIPSGSTCLGAGGRPGLIFSGSGTTPDGRIANIPTVGSSTSTAALNAALTNAGLGGITSRGFTFNDAGTTARPAVTPGDDYDLGPQAYMIVPQRRLLGNVFAHYDFSDAATLYVEGTIGNNQVRAQLPSTGVSGNFLVNTNNPYLSPQLQAVLRALDARETGTTTVTNGTSTVSTTPNDGLAVLNINRRVNEIGLRTNLSDIMTYRGAAGLRGRIGSVSDHFLSNLRYDVYYSYARTVQTDTADGAVSLSAFQNGILSQNGAAPLLNIFGANISAAGAAAIDARTRNVTTSTQQVAAGNITGELFQLPAGPVDFNAGVEWRRSAASFAPDARLASGDLSGFNASLPTSGHETAREVFGEVRVPILAHRPMFERLNVNGAFRYSNYDLSGVGGVWTYSGGVEYAPVRDITFRGQYQRSIRAPNVGELFGGNTTTGPTLTDPCSSRQPTSQQTSAVRAVCAATGVPANLIFTSEVQPNQFIFAVGGGNPNIGPEKSNTYTGGLVLTPSFLRGFAFSADYFNIDLKGAIAPLGGSPQNVLNLCYNVVQSASSPFCRAITRDPLTGQIAAPGYITATNANTGALKTSGVDFEGSYNFRTAWGLGDAGSRFEIGTDITWTRAFTSVPVAALPTSNECVGSYGQTCGQPIPEWKGTTRFTWKSGPLALSLRHRFIGAVTVDTYILPLRSGGTVPDKASLTNPTIPTQHYFDLSTAIDITRSLQLTAGVNNIADRDPPIVGSAAPSDNTFAATYDIGGRTFFFGVTAKF
ncbi:TonB-dependent receptor domain-containing protein [Sphingomonas nostoxanthinifaciens]|uniref:TonB-dependent receptor domain-containing protein n=1 Tax=Sphingomonas nostoxanthinifaciens TaxID=2872652 RepID=UPI001CC1EDE0|nr:TonB-dependent receptor [Sphingomonas nostoxanthinifaciens]UAK26101.1 TonB-dependent receptor [Sphingomonas nostoxanthinifaciens]